MNASRIDKLRHDMDIAAPFCAWQGEGRYFVHIRQALAKVTEALAGGATIPQSAHDLMVRHTAPTWIYRLIWNFAWKPGARQYSAEKRLRDVPYQVECIQRQGSGWIWAIKVYQDLATVPPFHNIGA